jgi:hypothetical protein
MWYQPARKNVPRGGGRDHPSFLRYSLVFPLTILPGWKDCAEKPVWKGFSFPNLFLKRHGPPAPASEPARICFVAQPVPGPLRMSNHTSDPIPRTPERHFLRTSPQDGAELPSVLRLLVQDLPADQGGAHWVTRRHVHAPRSAPRSPGAAST